MMKLLNFFYEMINEHLTQLTFVLGNHKCRETWQSKTQEKAYNIFLDVILLLLPLLIMLVTYSLISKTLFQAMRNERMQRDYCGGPDIKIRRRKSKKTKTEHRLTSTPSASSCSQVQRLSSTSSSRTRVGSMKTLTLRRTNAEKSLVSKKRVVRMLFVVVLEFFICWAPLYVINTIALFDSSVVYNNLGYTAISFFQLLAYTSSCCNPITYCFMNRSFRKSFLNLFGCLNEYRNECGTLGSEINMDSRFRSFRNHIYSANSV
ncbi:hypothetical protein WA026_019195 [Henosepilachna vigintioctopunctata]|uniref:G-protein coupled receptors family 1 profile domain-containing protein n=1 Tax=Henosepilachna vigintioctopunctata TaxID=420089 RepID=A0AAW1V3R9_9CUCU